MWRAPGAPGSERCVGTASLRKLCGKLASQCGGLPLENPAARRVPETFANVGETFANKGRIHPSRLPLRNRSTDAHKRGDIGGEELRLRAGLDSIRRASLTAENG